MRQDTKANSIIHDLVILIDFIVLNVLFCLWFHYDRSGSQLSHSLGVYRPLFVANMAMVVAQYFYSTVIHHHRSTSEQMLRQVTYLVLLQGVMTYVFSAIVSYVSDLSAHAFSFTACFTLMLYAGILVTRVIERWCVKRYRRLGGNIRKVVFVGADESMLPVFEYLVGDPSTGYRVSGYYADAPMQDCPPGLRHCGTLSELDARLEAGACDSSADEVYCCLPLTDADRIRRIIRYCDDHVVHFYYIPSISNALGRLLKPESVGGMTLFTSSYDPLMVPANIVLKRTFDIVVSALVLLCMLPFVPFIAMAIKLQSPGPVFFRQARTGLNGRQFYCYKFRSMHVNADSDRLQATEHDPRKFAFGNFMRKANIDELPQFFNVLRGDMSIVGPRPHMLYHTEMYRPLIDKYMVRHFVRPGITGWAQVTGYRGETKELWQMEGRVKRDIWYIENWSVWLDIRIMLMTLKQVFVHDANAY